MNKATVLKEVAAGLAIYDKVGNDAPTYPLKAVEEYEKWFREQFILEIVSRLTINKGRWVADDKSHLIIGVAGRMASDACRAIIMPVITHWLETQYPLFWKAGIEFATMMNKMQGLSVPLLFNEADTAQINILITGEIATQQDHIDHHRRYIERNISSALTLGWTTERFVEAMTVPQGIVGYPFGNTRYSWKTHISRMIEGRPRAVCAAAAENRAFAADEKGV